METSSVSLGFEPVDREIQTSSVTTSKAVCPALGKLRFIEVKGRVRRARRP